MNTNQITVIGNLARDPDVKGTQSGKTYCRFTLAANRQVVNRETGEVKTAADFVPCAVWGKDATAMASYVKGDRLLVVGRFTSRSWQDQQGQKHYMQEIAADIVAAPIGGVRSSASGPAYERPAAQAPYTPQGNPQPYQGRGNFGQFGQAYGQQPQYQQGTLAPQPATSPFTKPDDEDIPF